MINEAKLNLPKEYIDKIHDFVKEKYGFSGPSPQEMQEFMGLLRSNMMTQRGHEEELENIAKEVILKYYGPILDGVDLNIKIVNPDDEEKIEMTMRMVDDETAEEELDEKPDKKLEKEVEKRKLINNIMQGEAQNVHDMMYDMKDEIEDITGSNELLKNYLRLLEINKKSDWNLMFDLEQAIKSMPGGANAMEIDYNDEDEDGGVEIKVRALDLPMLFHETIKGIYELIAANAINPDPEVANKILQQTDTLPDEQEDIRYGPFIAKDVRNFINKVIDKERAGNIPNIREFIFGEMVQMNAEEFVDMMLAVLQDDESVEETISAFIKNIKSEFEEYERGSFEEEPEELQDPEEVEDEPEFQHPVKPTIKDYSDMSKKELDNELNKAIDSENWPLAQKIQSYIKESSK